jgi:hypothetical protein
VRGKKNLIIERSLGGPIGTIVKVSELQDYGVDKFFFLENNNADTSQRNVVFVARGECARHAQTIAGQFHPLLFLVIRQLLFAAVQCLARMPAAATGLSVGSTDALSHTTLPVNIARNEINTTGTQTIWRLLKLRSVLGLPSRRADIPLFRTGQTPTA